MFEKCSELDRPYVMHKRFGSPERYLLATFPVGCCEGRHALRLELTLLKRTTGQC